MKSKNILADAKATPSKVTLETHRKAILLLRDKGYTWRDISDFFSKRGVHVDHTKIYRFINKPKSTTKRKIIMTVISSEKYQEALSQISMTDNQKMMLKAHFEAPNRSITYTQLAAAVGYEDYEAANSQYGKLGRALGEAVGFQFVDSENHIGEKFYSSSIGMPNAYATGEFQLVMHHELSKALEALQMF